MGQQESIQQTPEKLVDVEPPKQKTVQPPAKREPIKSTKKLLVIEIPKHKRLFAKYFKKWTVHGEEIEVHQTGWDDIDITTYFSTESSALNPVSAYVSYRKGNDFVTFKPDFILIRNEAKEPEPYRQFQNILYALMYANIPSINSLHSIYCFLERPVVFAELIKIRTEHGFDKFPLISQNFYPNHESMTIGPEFPAVVKVSHAHAGFGKMKISSPDEFEDLKSILALTTTYCTGEPFYSGIYDLRVQKIGDRYRVYKRYSVSGNWKTNTGCSMLEEIEVTPQYKFWADAASQIFGGVDILAVDAIHTEDDKEYILEVNGGSIGLGPEKEEEDYEYIAELTAERMNKLLAPSKQITQ